MVMMAILNMVMTVGMFQLQIQVMEYAVNTFGAAFLDDASDCMLDWDGDHYGDDAHPIQTYLQEQTVRMI